MLLTTDDLRPRASKTLVMTPNLLEFSRPYATRTEGLGKRSCHSIFVSGLAIDQWSRIIPPSHNVHCNKLRTDGSGTPGKDIVVRVAVVTPEAIKLPLWWLMIWLGKRVKIKRGDAQDKSDGTR